MYAGDMKNSASSLAETNQQRPAPTRVTRSSPSRGTSSQLEQQQQLRALYGEPHHFDPASSESSVVVDSRQHQRVTRSCEQQQATKENVNRNHGPKSSNLRNNNNSPVPLKDKQRDGSKNDGVVMTDKTDEVSRNNNSAVTPSPKPDKGSSPLPSKSKTASTDPPEDDAARAARRQAWPLRGITEPGPNDCLFGRGGGTNHHPGNKLYRKVVEDHKETYLASKRLDKPLISMQIIADWRALDPPGRFLKQDARTKFWNDVGDKKAREKTSQALREKTPVKARGDDDGRSAGEPTARFATHGSLARDHSLGETFTNNEISLEGFSWDGSDRPVVRNESADESPTHTLAAGERRGEGGEGGGGKPRPRRREEPPHYRGGRERPPRDPYSREEQSRGEYRPGPSPHHYPYTRDPSLSNNPPSDASAYHHWEHSSYYGHHYSGSGPPPLSPPPGHPHGQHPPPPPPPPPGHVHPPPTYYHPHPPPPPYSSPQHHHHQASYSHHPPASQQRSREHSLQMNPLKGASISQPAPDTFADEHSSRHHYRGPPPPPLPSPTYENHPPPYYGYAPSPRQGGWPTPPGRGGASPAPKPQFSCRSGSNPSAFGRYDAGSRANSIQSLGSSVDAYYDRRDSGASSGGSVAAAASRAVAPPPPSPDYPVVAVAGTFKDFNKIAELIRDSSERTRSNSLDESSRAEKGGYEDEIPRSKSMPHRESGNNDGSPRGNGEEDIPLEPATPRQKPNLLRKLSGGSIPDRQSPLIAQSLSGGSNGSVFHPKPIKRDTSNQPETLETKRSIKRVVLSRDQSAVSRRLKQEQKQSGKSDQRLKRADLIDRKLSVEINKMGLEDIEGYDRPSLDRMTTKNILGRMTTEDVLGCQHLDRMTTEDVLGAFIDDDDHSPQLGSPSPPSLHGGDRTTTIDAIALKISNDISNGNGLSRAGAEDWDDTLDLVNDPTLPSAPVVHDGEMSGGVNADIAEKWLKGET